MNETAVQNQPADNETNKLAFLPVLAFGVGLGVVLAYVIYFGVWKKLPAGGPDAWANFGDYFGGLVNPVAGVVTVFLVFFTLKATRKEARDTRTEMKAQLKFLADQQSLADLHRRLDGLYKLWLDHTSDRRHTGFIGGTAEIPVQSPNNESLASIFGNEDYRLSAVAYRDLWEPGDAPWTRIQTNFGEAAELLSEMDVVLQMYDKIAKNPDLTDFYRLRLWRAAAMLSAWKLVNDEIRHHFVAASERLVAMKELREPGLAPA